MNTQSKNHSDRSVAVAHGNYVARGGGELVAEEIARTFDAPIYYGFGDEQYEPDDIECYSLFNDVFGSSLLKRVYQLRDAYYMYGWRSVPELHSYDIIIQSGNEPGWYKPLEDQTVVKYTHSTPRNAYDKYPSRAPQQGLIYEAYTFATEQLYESVLSYPDLYVANSDVVRRRIEKYWGFSPDDIQVVYPPVKAETLGADYAADTPIDEQYYLVLDRLEPTKNIDEIIEAFQAHPDKNLVIAGTGSKEDELQSQASDLPNVTFRGFVSEGEKQALMAGAQALVYAAEDEDFGIVPIEALASGTPVIGPQEGFTRHQIADGVTGVLYDRNDGGVEKGLAQFADEGVSSTAAERERVADQYNVDRFREEIRAAVETAVERSTINPNVATPPETETNEKTTSPTATLTGNNGDE